MYKKPGMREVTGKNNPDGKHDEVKMVRERVNMSAREDRFDKDTVRHGDDDDKEKTAEKHLYEKPEERDVMADINPKGKYDEDVNVGNVDNRVDENNAEKLSSQSRRPSMGEPVIKSFGDVAFENTLDKDPGKGKGHVKPEIRAVMVNMYEKPETRDMMDNITDAVMLKHGVRGWRQGPPRQGVQRVREARDEGWDAQDQPQGQVRREHEREQRDGQEQRGRPYRRPEMRAVMVDIINAVMLNMYKKPETRDVMDDITDAVMLKHGV